MDTIEKDFLRYAHQHSYYKHCSPRGEKVIMVRKKGQQPRNDIYPGIKDATNMHWWFLCEDYCKENDIPLDYHVTINSFTRGLEDGSFRFPQGFHIIKSLYKDELREYITEKYPEFVESIYAPRTEDEAIEIERDEKICYIFDREQKEQLEQARAMAASWEADKKYY